MTNRKVFVASDEAKGKAKQLRLFAMLAWIMAIAGEVFAILKLINNETMTMLIVAIVVIMALAITGSMLWKKSNRLDPASEKDKLRFFVQNQLGAIMAALAFLPLIIVIFTNKDLDGKTKGIVGTIGMVALLIAGIAGIDFNPPSVEKYTEQINAQTDLIKNLNNDVDLVYWTNKGGKYHLDSNCQHIRNREQHNGTVADAWEERKIGDSELCATCRKAAEKKLGAQPEEGVSVDDLLPSDASADMDEAA